MCLYIQPDISLIFEGKNWYMLLQGKKSDDLPEKNAIYRFLNNPTYNWRRFLLSLSAATISKVSTLTGNKRPKVLIVDDSSYDEIEVKRSNCSHAALTTLHKKCVTAKGSACLRLVGLMERRLCQSTFPY